MKRVAVLLALALLTVPPVSAVSGANPRAETLDTLGAINDLALATDKRSIAVATQDAGSLAPGPAVPPEPDQDNPLSQTPDLNTWYLWESDGVLEQAGPADMPDCDTRDTCQSHSVAVALSEDGRRLAVATNIPAPVLPVPPDTVRGQVQFITDTQGVVFTKTFDQNIIDIDFDATGAAFAIALRVPASAGGVDGALVQAYTWAGGGANTLALKTADDIATPVIGIDLSADGKTLVVATDRHHRYVVMDGSLPAVNTGVTGKVTDVAVAEGQIQWSVAGYSTGRVVLYSKTEPSVPRANRLVSEAAITSVAIRRDLLGEGVGYAAGDNNGRLHLFTIDAQASPPGVFQRSMSLGGAAVRDLSYSEDGRYLVARTGAVVHFLQVNATAATTLWTHTFATAPRTIAVDGKGELVAAAVGTSVTLFDASHRILSTLPETPTIAPGAFRDLEATFKNDGNRPETLTLSAGYPEGWVLLLEETTLSLAPGETATVPFRLVVGEGAAPGDHTVFLNHTLGGTGLKGSAALSVDVPLIRRLVLEESGPLSLGVEPGNSVLFRFKVANHGNANDGDALRATASRTGWAAALSQTAPTLSPGQETEVRLTVEAPTDALRGDFVRVTVQLASNPAQSLSFTATVGASFGPTLSLPAGLVVHPGNQTRFQMTLGNQGNAPDDIQVAIDGLPAGWVLAFDNGQDTFTLRQLPRGEATTVQGTVRVPVTEELGVRQLRVTATSLGDREQSVTKTLILTVEEPPQGPDDGGQDGPGLAFVPLLAALAGMALWRRRKEA